MLSIKCSIRIGKCAAEERDASSTTKITLLQSVRSSRFARLIPYIDTPQLHPRSGRFWRFWVLTARSLPGCRRSLCSRESLRIRQPASCMTTKQFWLGDLRQPITTNIQGLFDSWYEWKRCLSPGEPAIFKNRSPGSGCLCQFVEQRTCDWIENDPGAHTAGDVLDAGH